MSTKRDSYVPDISIVIPTYENLNLVALSAMSALTQVDVKAEVILIDDSKSDQVEVFAATLKSRFPQLRYLAGARNGNPVDNWNKGIDAAKGQYYILLHQDEILIDAKYAHDAVTLLNSTNALAVISRCQTVSMGRTSRFALVERWARRLKPSPWLIYVANWIGPTAVFAVRRDEAPRFDSSLTWLVDTDQYARTLTMGKRIFYRNTVSVCSLAHHDAQITASIRPHTLAHHEITYLSKGRRDQIPVLIFWVVRITIFLRSVFSKKR